MLWVPERNTSQAGRPGGGGVRRATQSEKHPVRLSTVKGRKGGGNKRRETTKLVFAHLVWVSGEDLGMLLCFPIQDLCVCVGVYFAVVRARVSM